jgi:hypothetical protein
MQYSIIHLAIMMHSISRALLPAPLGERSHIKQQAWPAITTNKTPLIDLAEARSMMPFMCALLASVEEEQTATVKKEEPSHSHSSCCCMQ